MTGFTYYNLTFFLYTLDVLTHDSRIACYDLPFKLCEGEQPIPTPMCKSFPVTRKHYWWQKQPEFERVRCGFSEDAGAQERRMND